MRSFRFISRFTALFFIASLGLHAQDLRHVTKPHVPPACTVLRAKLAAVNGVLPANAEQHLDTLRIQQAIDHCTPGKAVVLRADGPNQTFLTGPLTLRSGVTLVISANTSLAASRNPRLYDITPGSCGILGKHGRGCKPLITGNNISNAGIMGKGSIDGQGGARILGRNATWWQLAHRAKVLDKYQKVPGLIALNHVHNFTLYEITLRDSPGWHVHVSRSNGFTAWGVKIMTPGTARNTDGIDPGSSTNVTITHCYIHAGDDDVAVGSGGGVPASHISIIDNHFYTGHGMSIGSGTSGGVNHMLVKNLTIDGAQNGIRIKSDPSRGGLVKDITYENVCIRNVTNPIVLTPHYTDFTGHHIPDYRDITLRNVHILAPGYYIFSGLNPHHMLGVTLDNVFANGLNKSHMLAGDADVTLGPNVGNLVPHGPNVHIKRAPGSHPGQPLSCKSRFVPFPKLTTAPKLAVKVPPVDHTLYVAADGTGDYYSIQRAINVAPSTEAVISVAPGVYHEVLTINKPNITIRSPYKNASKTVIVADKSAGTAGGTHNSATVNVLANNFLAENITIENNYDATHPDVKKGRQAVALLVRGDRDIFDNVRLLGGQDTLYADAKACHGRGATRACVPARQFFYHCFVQGNIDFIFGDGKTVFDHCTINSTPHSKGTITAQSKSYPQQNSGFVFNDCRLTAAPGVHNVYLGRPWRPYSTVVYLNTWMGKQIAPAGWIAWHPGKTHRLATSFYAEYHSTGPGANPSKREPYSKQLTKKQAKKFEPQNFLRGSDKWNPIAIVHQLHNKY